MSAESYILYFKSIKDHEKIITKSYNILVLIIIYYLQIVLVFPSCDAISESFKLQSVLTGLLAEHNTRSERGSRASLRRIQKAYKNYF